MCWSMHIHLLVRILSHTSAINASSQVKARRVNSLEAFTTHIFECRFWHRTKTFALGDYLKSAENKLNEYEINIVMQSPVVANKLIPETAYFSHAWTHCSSLTDKKKILMVSVTLFSSRMSWCLNWTEIFSWFVASSL